jgi:hypothetical protein
MLLLGWATGHRLDAYPNLLKDDLGALCSAPVHTVSVSGPLGGDLIDTKMVHVLASHLARMTIAVD